MTAIVGLVHNDTVHLAGDSAGIGGWNLTVRADAKVFRRGPYVMGFTSSFRMGQLLRYALDTPPVEDVADDDLAMFMVVDFVNAVRTTLRNGGWLRKDSDREDGGTFLVGTRGRLFTIADDFQVGEAIDGYTAIGCGNDLALGALYATSRRTSPTSRLRIALEAAERHSAGVRGPYAFVSTSDREAHA